MAVLLVQRQRSRRIAARKDIGTRLHFVIPSPVLRQTPATPPARDAPPRSIRDGAAIHLRDGARQPNARSPTRVSNHRDANFCRRDDARMRVKALAQLSTKGCAERIYTSRANSRRRPDGGIRSKYVPCYDKILHHIL
jgi:hypothetical protein